MTSRMPATTTKNGPVQEQQNNKEQHQQSLLSPSKGLSRRKTGRKREEDGTDGQMNRG